MKKYLLLTLSILLAALCGCGLLDDDVPRETIFAYVAEKHESLETFLEGELPNSQASEEASIRNVLGRKTIVKSVYRYNDNILEFYCGGTGLSVSSTYSGFYYSADDTPFGFELNSHELKETSPGVFEWESSGDGIITERILPHWFYYHLTII